MSTAAPPTVATTTATTTASAHNVSCVTREDSRASATGYTTSPAGTLCKFGVDDRDEGEHCIIDGFKFGSFGWCFTDASKSSWGSCSETCPLLGAAKVLSDKIDDVAGEWREARDAFEAAETTTEAPVSTTAT